MWGTVGEVPSRGYNIRRAEYEAYWEQRLSLYTKVGTVKEGGTRNSM